MTRTAPAAIALLLSAASLATAAGPTRLAQAASGDTSLLLVAPAGGTAHVERGDGRIQALPLPAGAELSTIATLGSGWVVAGTQQRGARRDLLLLRHAGGRVRQIASPPAQSGALRRDPVPLVSGDRLVGLAWLEGADAGGLAVRTSSRRGDRWTAPEAVSLPGPGSQLALAGAVLADGTWLLVWSAYDGHDDEIYWSRRDAAGWSTPQRVGGDNAVPDVLPGLVAMGDGALLAWSRYDGSDYRLEVARFTAGSWTEGRTVGPRGSAEPSFTVEGDRAWVLFHTAAPAGWTLQELAGDGTAGKAAVFATGLRDRPAVAERRGASAVLRWPAGAVVLEAPWK